MICLSAPTTEGTNELMRHKLTSVILATGNHAMVKAAYSSGKPAYGVGAGNVPAFIERTARIPKAVADIISGKLFDYGVLCSTESALICDAPVKRAVLEECSRRGAHFVTGDDKLRLSRLLFDDRGGLNPDVVGKSAPHLAQRAGITVPATTTVLVAELDAVGRTEPLSREKLSPVLAFYTVDGWRDGCHRCIELLEFGGIGHSMVIHSSDQDIILKFAMEKPAFRIMVNTQSALGAVGYTTGLDPSMTLGPGTWGGSIVSDNVTARHLMNIKRLAFETNPVNPSDTTNDGRTLGWIRDVDRRVASTPGPGAQQGQDVGPIGTRGALYGAGLEENTLDALIARFKKEIG
jgi:acetaldehyde dehydrogenase (acetylating)